MPSTVGGEHDQLRRNRRDIERDLAAAVIRESLCDDVCTRLGHGWPLLRFEGWDGGVQAPVIALTGFRFGETMGFFVMKVTLRA
jgi:hypothetical protein